MDSVLQIGDRSFAAHELVPLLSQYQLLPNLVREVVIDQTLEPIALSEDEMAAARQEFCDRQQITSEEQLQAWLQQRSLSSQQLEAMITREQKLSKFKAETWGSQVDSHFLQRKTQLDRVLYALIRTEDAGLAQELYFRIRDDNEPFSELALRYSQGQEAQTGGLVGPVELSVPHPTLGRMLSISQPGQIWPPTKIGEWFVVVRLEKFLPAQLDDAMRQRLLNELFSAWLQQQLQQTAVNMPAPETGIEPDLGESEAVNHKQPNLPQAN
ncbi:peptidylprolyl isomerase [Sphaerothrix gracilis]|uniref:peptidylprolyl isomerase n=1 Tax=Sphaerothrix gracilis TaxID=3151835 RepID=UPI0031FCBCBA